MSAVWQKNQATAAKRRCLLIVTDDSGMPASPGLDLMSLGAVFFVGANAPDADLALGTCTNVRRPLVVADDTFTATHGTEMFTATAHGLQTGDGPVRVSNSGGALPTGLSAGTDYYVIKSTADDFQLASSLANAYAGTAVAISDNGTGTHTLSDTASTERGIWGHYIYEATQTETNHDNPESLVFVDYTGYLRMNGGGALTTVDMASDSEAWSGILEGAITRDDALRVLLRGEIAPYSISGGVYTIRDLADTKDSHHGTITGSGRSSTVIDDAS